MAAALLGQWLYDTAVLNLRRDFGARWPLDCCGLPVDGYRSGDDVLDCWHSLLAPAATCTPPPLACALRPLLFLPGSASTFLITRFSTSSPLHWGICCARLFLPTRMHLLLTNCRVVSDGAEAVLVSGVKASKPRFRSLFL